jgi:hypothetical protein
MANIEKNLPETDILVFLTITREMMVEFDNKLKECLIKSEWIRVNEYRYLQQYHSELTNAVGSIIEKNHIWEYQDHFHSLVTLLTLYEIVENFEYLLRRFYSDLPELCNSLYSDYITDENGSKALIEITPNPYNLNRS